MLTQFIKIEFPYPVYSNRIENLRLYNNSYRSCESNHEIVTRAQLASKMWRESKTEDTEQVATRQIYCCCSRDSNSQHTLNFGD